MSVGAQLSLTAGGPAAAPEWLPWVAAARRGDRAAWQRLFEAFAEPLYAFLWQMTRDDQRATDLTQEVFVRALQSLATLRQDAAFRAWLFRIGHNLVRDQAAKATAVFTADEALLERPDPHPGAAELWERRELAAAVEQAVAALEPEHRAVVVLHHLQDLPLATVARIVGVREGTVKSRLARAREILRRRLTPWVES